MHIEPALPGTWRWVGTQTLTFEYDSTLIDRLPKATDYHVSVAAGTKSATGGALEKAVEWSFSTPPAVMTAHYPGNDPQPQNTLIFIAFDQRIDPAAVLETIQVTAGGRAVSLNLGTETEVRSNPNTAAMLKNSPVGRWLAFSAVEPLPLGTEISVTVGPKTPSAEGPLLTK